MKRSTAFFQQKKVLVSLSVFFLCLGLLGIARSTYRAHTMGSLYDATPEELQRCLEDKGTLSSWGWYSNDELVSHQFFSTGISELGPVTLAEAQEITIEVKTRHGAAKLAVLSPTGDLRLLEQSAASYLAQAPGEYRVYSVMKQFWGKIQVKPGEDMGERNHEETAETGEDWGGE